MSLKRNKKAVILPHNIKIPITLTGGNPLFSVILSSVNTELNNQNSLSTNIEFKSGKTAKGKSYRLGQVNKGNAHPYKLKRTKALLDSGAQVSVIPANMLAGIDYSVHSNTEMTLANGTSQKAPMAYIRFWMPQEDSKGNLWLVSPEEPTLTIITPQNSKKYALIGRNLTGAWGKFAQSDREVIFSTTLPLKPDIEFSALP